MADLTLVRPAASDALHRLADDFLADKRANGKAAKTTEMYQWSLDRIFLPWCAEAGITEPSQLTDRALVRFVSSLREHGGPSGAPLSDASVNSYSRSVRAFLHWAEKELGERVKVPMKKLPRQLLEVLSTEEIQRMEDVARSERDELLVRTLADTGIRLGELLGLRAKDLVETDRGRYQLRVDGKTGQRLVPCTPALARRLRRHLSRRHAEKGDRMFVGTRRSARTGEYEPLTANGAEQAIRHLGKEAGIGRRVYPHLFRHSYATLMLRRGMSTIQLQSILGHSSITMIAQVYSHLNTDDAYDAAMKALLGGDE
ncbi:MAG: tyrosine-type recombinase/integrase [Candidatus Dormiibacterota bacterium]